MMGSWLGKDEGPRYEAKRSIQGKGNFQSKGIQEVESAREKLEQKQ